MDELINLLRERGSERTRVAIDIDSTLAVIIPLMIDNFNRAKGTNFTADDHTDWDFKNLGSDYMEMMPYYAEVWKSQHTEIQFSGNVKQINELARHYYVSLLTTRSPTNEGVTGGTVDTMQDWLRIHQLGRIPVEICDPKQNKARDFNYNVYVDDSPRLAETIQGMDGKFILLVDQKYNMYVPNSSRVLHVANSEEATRLLLDLARTERARRIRG